MSEVPEDRCGFEMLAADVSRFEMQYADSLSEAVESNRVAVCCRETVEDGGRCLWHTDEVDKSGVELPEVDHDRPVVLDGAKISSCEFPEAQPFAGVRMRFAELSQTNLFDADLSEADLTGADLSEADLTGADLSETDLGYADLSEATLAPADLSEADLKRADLSEADLGYADLSEADLRYADLSEADLRYADLSEAYLIDADLSEAYLIDADLSEAYLKRADLPEADLERADLPGASLSDANMTAVQATGATLQDATLERTDLSKANLFDVNLTGTELYGAILSDIRLNDATEFGDHYTDEDDSIEKATWTLRQIEQISRESALPEQVTEAVVERKTRRRKHHWQEGNYLSWLRNAGFGLLTKYGESPGRVVGLSVGTILVSAGLFQHTGIRDTTNGGEVISFALENTTAANLVGKSLYLSTVTFTTVGYGDLQPVGLGQLVATVESFLGALLMALLVFVLGRRATR